MVTDVVEASEEQTGRRSEGTFTAGGLFASKCATGIGIFTTGMLLEFAGMPEKAVPGQVPVEVIDRLALTYSGIIFVLALAVVLVLRRFPITRADHEARLAALDAAAMPVDHVAGAAPLGHRVSRLAGPDWLLVGDAAGFLDPFTGEGLRRALASAFLAADATEAALAGRRQALDGYDHAMRRRFRAKDTVSLLVQGFLARPALFEYAARRLAARRDVRRTLELVLADLSPASRALDPRTLAALLAP
jgi:hypothetical protein